MVPLKRILPLLATAWVLAAPAQAQLTLTVVKSGTGIGTIVSAPGGISCAETCASASAAFSPGTSVTLTWTTYGPTTFSSITKWSGGGCDGAVITNGANSSCTVSMTSDTVVTATVLQYAYAIIALRQGTGHGAFLVNNATICPAFNWCYHYELGPFPATISAIPDSQSTFLGWSGMGCSGTAACSINVTGRNFVTASFGSKAAPSPVFPMTVIADITPSVANATASVQFRPQDVGATASLYVFAVAPSGLVKAAKDGSPSTWVGDAVPSDGRKGAPVPCVLAQLDPSGQLTGTSNAQLQAYASGVLSAQGAAVTILNNEATPAVAGATFYVGYGSSSTAMFTNGIFRNALTVPGSGTCPMVSSQTALWWNPAESGWGINFEHQGNILFGTLFAYDANRQPLWLMLSSGALQSDGVTFAGDLYRTTGPAFNANPFKPITFANLTKVGAMSVSFQDVNSGTLQYSVNGSVVSKGIQRQVFGSRAAACFPTTTSRATSKNYQDLWWNPNESGWGLNITHQDDTIFATLFTYDLAGRGVWLVLSSAPKQADGSYAGTLYQASGPPFDADPFTPISGANLSQVGTMRLSFTDGSNATLTYTYNGVQVTKSITRQVFSSPLPLCN